MKKILSILISFILSINLFCFTAYAEPTTSDLISKWFSSAIKYASLGEYENFKSLYGDIDKSIINKEFEFFRDTVYKKNYKCIFSIVSDRKSGQSITDVMIYKTKKQKNGDFDDDWMTTQMCFMKYNNSVVRIPINFFLRVDYVKSNDPEYIDGFVNNEPWVKYNNKVFSQRAVPTLRYAKVNDDGSITIVISVVNTHDKKATVYCLFPYQQSDMLKFNGQKINIEGLLEVKTIPANCVKNYTIKIPAKRYSGKLTNNDLHTCEFKFAYSYMCDGQFYEGFINCKYQGHITI